MLKFVDTKVVFAEIPDEITLAVNISGCPCACRGCHSRYLAEDIGEELCEESIDTLLKRHSGVSCICFMGGDAEPERVSQLAAYIKTHSPKLKVAWYSGRDEISPLITLCSFDFIKVGSYRPERGSLECATTNQRLYRINAAEAEDITKKMWQR